MHEVTDIAEVSPAEAILDPFSFIAGASSRIGGLGGSAPANDPDYAFHTPYVEAAPGPCNFTVRFTGLTAKYGTLQLRVHMISHTPGSAAITANMDRIALNRLVQYGGEFSLKFEGFRGYSYALMGLVVGDTDARADELVVALDRPADAASDDVSSDGLPTSFGRDAIDPVTHLVSSEPPSFTVPVTQFCTRPQLTERAFLDWKRDLARPSADDLTIWREAFILQALQQYGMMERGARGLALDARDRTIPDMLIGRGLDVLVTSTASLRDDEESSGEPVVQEIGLDPFPASLVDFDFAFSTDWLARMRTQEQRSRLVEQSMNCLRGGGIMIHVAPANLLAEYSSLEEGGRFCGRSDIERMALIAISRNHEVAQFKISRIDAVTDAAQLGEIGAFGIIMRRAPSIRFH